MNMTRLHTKHQIDRLGSMALHNVRGQTVTCVSGSVWLTMEGDARDVVLEPGASFVIDRDGLTILAAYRSSVVQVSAQNEAPGWWSRFVDFLNHTYGPAAIRSDRKWVY